MTVYYVRIYPANKEIASNECGRKEMNIFVLYMLHKRSQFTCKLYFICLKKDFCLTTVKSMDETATYPKFRILSAFMITYPEVGNHVRVNNKDNE